jgi:hypothetical protein
VIDQPSRHRPSSSAARTVWEAFQAGVGINLEDPAWWAWPTTTLDRDERPVEAHAYADRVVIRQEGSIVARTRSSGRSETA